MKRLFSILISSLILTTSAWAVTVEDINSYASKLAFSENSKSGNVNANRQVEVEFYTMASTSKWWVYMDVNQDGVYEEREIIARNENAKITKNNVTTTVVCTIPNTVPAGEYTWAVKVQGEDRSDWSAPKVARNYENTDHRYEFSRAMGVTYIYSYESNRFGYSYVTETFQNKTAWTGGRTTTDGIYGFGPAMGESYNKDANGNLKNYGAYTGGLTWSTGDHNNYYKESSPFRLSTDKEGYVYVCDAVLSSSRTGRVFRMNPSSPTSDFVTVLTTTHLSQNGLPTHLQAATVGYDKSGNKVLYAILGTINSDGTIANNVCICEFNINDLNNITYKRQKSLYQFTQSGQSQKLTIINAYNTIVAGEYGDLWIFQSRGGSNAAQPSAVHLNADWTCDYIIPSSSELNRRGSGALTKDGKILAMPTGSAIIKFYDITYSNTSNGSISKLTEKKYSLTVPQIDSKVPYVDAMVFDVANNLYIAANIGAGYSESQGRLYVYALPKADNSHITPARSSLKIRVSEGLTWHPYPDGYNVTNADLQAMFNADRANWSGSLTDFMTNNTSPWKWLGDYISNHIVPTLPTDIDSDDNEELWIKFKKANDALSSLGTLASIKSTSAGRTHGDPNTPCGCRIICNNNDLSHAVTTSILSSPDWKWLKDYIKSVQTSLVDNFSDDTNNYWKYAVAAFFLQSQHSSWPTSADFSTAGKPSVWGPAYLAANGGYTPLKTDADWQTQLNNFFNATGVYATAGQSDQAHNGANGWYNEWWNANFPSAMVNAVAFPTVKRVGHVQNGWYYGGSEGYESAAREMSGAVQHSGHIWARWLEVSLYEGYLSVNNSNVTEFSSEEKTIKEVNRNIELINLLAGQEVAIKIDRKLVGGMYNTMCLPFDIAGKEAFSQIVYADGPGSPFAKEGGVYPFSLVKYVGTVAGDDVLMLDFDELGAAETLPANTPFLLKPNADITTPLKYNAARISGGGAQPASDDSGEDDEENDEGGSLIGQNYGITVGYGDEYFTYTGVLAPTTIPDGSVLLVADNRLAQSTGGEMKGMRGFFTAKIQPLQMPAVVRITSRDGVTTYLDAINMTTESKTATKVLHNGQIYILRGDEIYTLTGARVK